MLYQLSYLGAAGAASSGEAAVIEERHSHCLEHDPQNLQTFRTRSCVKSKRYVETSFPFKTISRERRLERAVEAVNRDRSRARGFRSPRLRPRVSVGHRSAHDIARCTARRADIKSVEVILVPEMDAIIDPLGIKGFGEVANIGTSAAIANAVDHATGKRIRKLPIRIETLLG